MIDADEKKFTLSNNNSISDTIVLSTIGFFATVKFSVINSAQIKFYVGASPENLLLNDAWTVTADGTNGDNISVGTKARYLKIEIDSASPFNCTVAIVRQ